MEREMESDRRIKFFIYRDRRVLLVLHKVTQKKSQLVYIVSCD